MGSGWPSTSMRSELVTLHAGEAITAPLTATRPAAIHVSAARREHSPARAMTLAMRSPRPECSFCLLIATSLGSLPIPRRDSSVGSR
jgi:hypothetical protein